MKNKRISKITIFLLIALLITAISIVEAETYAGPKVYVFRFDGKTINQGLATALINALNKAESENAILLLIIDTPGGELDATEQVAKAILNSAIPVVGYVYPRGATAWSAGTIILLSCHIAAMAPGTAIGAAQPVMYGPEGFQPVNYSKIINPVAELVQTISKERGRNETAAYEFVTKNLTLNYDEALKSNVIDIVADNIPDLLSKINGITVKTPYGEVKINTKGYMLEEYKWSLGEMLSNTLADPLIANILLMLGFYILLISLFTGHYPMIAVGLLLFILGLFGMGFTINTISSILIIAGVILLVIELITPGFGILGTTGIVMIALGFILLPIYLPESWYITPEFYLRFLTAGLIIGFLASGFFALVIYKVVKAKRAKPLIWTIVGAKGKALDDIPPGKEGFVLIDGEYWMAISDEKISAGDEVVVVDKIGPKLKVRKAK